MALASTVFLVCRLVSSCHPAVVMSLAVTIIFSSLLLLYLVALIRPHAHGLRFPQRRRKVAGLLPVVLRCVLHHRHVRSCSGKLAFLLDMMRCT